MLLNGRKKSLVTKTDGHKIYFRDSSQEVRRVIDEAPYLAPASHVNFNRQALRHSNCVCMEEERLPLDALEDILHDARRQVCAWFAALHMQYSK